MADNISSSIQSWRYDAGSGVAAVSLSADGEKVLVGTLGKTAICLNSSGERLWQAQVGNQAWRAGLSGDGQTAVFGSGSTRFWDMKGRGLYCFAADSTLRWQQDLKASIWGLAVAADGRTVAAGTSAKQLLVFDEQGHLLWRQDIPGLGWYAWVWSASLSADGQIIAAGAADKRIRVWQRNGELLGQHRTRADVFATAVSANGRIISAGDSSGHIYCLDQNGNLLWEEALADKVWAVAGSADGQRLLVGAGEKEAHIRLYNQTGQLLWKRHVGGSVTNVGLSADGRRVVAGTREGGIFIFDEDQVIHQERVNKIVRDVAISSAGEVVVAGSEDDLVYGFHLPPLSPPESNTVAAAAKYQINISGGQGIIIGDQAQVTQHFGEKKPGLSSPVANDIRWQHLSNNIQQDLALLKEYEDALRYEDDPRRRARYRREIERLQHLAITYKAEITALKDEDLPKTQQDSVRTVSEQLQQMDDKLDAILQGQVEAQQQLASLRQAILAYLDENTQAIVATVITRLDESQLVTVARVIEALEAGRPADETWMGLLTAVQQTLTELQQQPVNQLDGQLAHDVQQVAEIVAEPRFDVRHKLKVAAPIIPFILSYEGEIELNSSLNLEVAWHRFAARLRGDNA